MKLEKEQNLVTLIFAMKSTLLCLGWVPQTLKNIPILNYVHQITLIIFFQGHDTTATAMVWFLYYMGTNPKHQVEKIRKNHKLIMKYIIN